MELHKPFDLGFTEEEKSVIDRIKIRENIQFLNYYDADRFESKVNLFVNDIGDNEGISAELTAIIHRIVKKVLADTRQESGIIWIRTKTDFVREHHRWHRDGRYFEPLDDGPVVKFAVTLRGNSTPIVVDPEAIKRFAEMNNKFREIINFTMEKLGSSSQNLFHRLTVAFDPEYDEIIGNNYVSANTGEGVYFLNMINGSTKTGTIHSEPLVERDRIFIAILPYTKEKCKEWVDKQRHD